ncbi:MAG: phosphate uptake regulator PhoU [Thermofilum sp.]
MSVAPEAGIVRRVQLTGGSTYIVSIPKEWASAVGIGKGSIVSLVLEQDGTIRLIPSVKRPRAALETEVRVGKKTTEGAIIRELFSKYLLGYKVIRAKFEEDSPALKKTIRDVLVSKLIGAEVMQESAREVVIQVLVNVEDIPVPEVVGRMRDTAQSMLEDPMTVLRGGEAVVDLEEVIARDDIVDKLYLYGLRQLYSAMRGFTNLKELGLSRLEEVLSHAMVMKNIERVSDHAAAIAATLLQTPELPNRDEIASLASEVAKFFRRSVDAFLARDRDSAHRLLDKDAIELREADKELSKRVLVAQDPEMVSNVRVILGSYRRVVEYSSDILEATIDLTEKA